MEKQVSAIKQELESLRERGEEIEKEEGLMEQKNEAIAALRSEVGALKQSEREKSFELAQSQEKAISESRQREELTKKLEEQSERMGKLLVEIQLLSESKSSLFDELQNAQRAFSDQTSEHEIFAKKSLNVLFLSP